MEPATLPCLLPSLLRRLQQRPAVRTLLPAAAAPLSSARSPPRRCSPALPACLHPQLAGRWNPLPTATLPFFGVEPALLDIHGNEVEGPGEG